MNRKELKRKVVEKLDSLCAKKPHPMGHQDVYANRYVYISKHGVEIELMFVKYEHDRQPANLCVMRVYVEDFVNDLRKDDSLTFKKNYRHSALDGMRPLNKNNNVYFKLCNMDHLDRILRVLSQVK